MRPTSLALALALSRSMFLFMAMAVVAVAPLAARAAGLGPITVTSALGQPLAAEIEVVALGPKEFPEIQARIASVDDYRRANVNYVPVLRQVRLSPEKRSDGRAVFVMTSVAPINEPSIEALVEFTWPGGRLLQKYPILLDPAR